jgi:hypothetical protein
MLKDSQMDNNKHSIKNMININNRKQNEKKIQKEKDNLIYRNEKNEFDYRQSLKNDLNIETFNKDRGNNDDRSIGLDSRGSTLSSRSINDLIPSSKKELKRIKGNLKNKSSILRDIKSERDKDKSLLDRGNKAGYG